MQLIAKKNHKNVNTEVFSSSNVVNGLLKDTNNLDDVRMKNEFCLF
jgi:hypothetical protein